jgi:hypothetical protein
MASKSGMKELPSDRKIACTSKRIGVKRPQSLVNFLSIDHPSSNNSNKRQKRAIDSKWNVENVPELPCLHMKEKTSVTLFDANIKTICEKIVDSAKALSAYGQYYDEKVCNSQIFNLNKFLTPIQLIPFSQNSTGKSNTNEGRNGILDSALQ